MTSQTKLDLDGTVAIPQFVANYIQKCQRGYFDLYEVFQMIGDKRGYENGQNDHFNQQVWDWLSDRSDFHSLSDSIHDSHVADFARAYVDDYTVGGANDD